MDPVTLSLDSKHVIETTWIGQRIDTNEPWWKLWYSSDETFFFVFLNGTDPLEVQ